MDHSQNWLTNMDLAYTPTKNSFFFFFQIVVRWIRFDLCPVQYFANLMLWCYDISFFYWQNATKKIIGDILNKLLHYKVYYTNCKNIYIHTNHMWSQVNVNRNWNRNAMTCTSKTVANQTIALLARFFVCLLLLLPCRRLLLMLLLLLFRLSVASKQPTVEWSVLYVSSITTTIESHKTHIRAHDERTHQFISASRNT